MNLFGALGKNPLFGINERKYLVKIFGETDLRAVLNGRLASAQKEVHGEDKNKLLNGRVAGDHFWSPAP